MRFWISILISISVLCKLNAQNSNTLDSLTTVLNNAKHDTTRIRAHLMVIRELYSQNPDTLLPMSNKMIALIDGVLPSLTRNQKHEFLALKANAYNNLGAYFNQKGDIPTALKYFNKSLKLKESLNEQAAIAKTLNNIGYIYEITGELENALTYYGRSLKIKKQLNDTLGMAYTFINIGSVYDTRNDTVKAMKNYKMSLAVFSSLHFEKGMANVLNNMAFLRSSRGNFKGVEQLYLESLNLREKINDVQGITESSTNLGYYYFNQKEYNKALPYAERAYSISTEIGFPEYIKRSAELLKDLYIHDGNYKKAVEMFVLYTKMKDSIMNESNRNEAIKNKFQYEFEKKASQDSIRNYERSRLERVKSQNEIKQQRNYIIGGGVVLILLVLIALLLYRAVKIKTRSEKLITHQKNIIETQKQLVEEKQSEILDSINYAKRIQASFLASEEELKKNLNEYSLFYRPKDIVSGDFYWCERVGNYTFVAVCDCTGHGIPGAFMSLLNISLLNEAVLSKGLTKPNEIFDFVRRIVIMGLNKGNTVKGQDGMDAILFCINSNEAGKILYAAANNAPCKISNGMLTELPFDKMPVGKSPNDSVPFSLYEMNVQPGDSIIAYTDGYADQFGGPKGKKFKYANLNKLLVECSTLSIHQQAGVLETNFENWMNYKDEAGKTKIYLQLDDVCILGIKV